MFHPTRGGTRGGQDQFKWEDVKEDKHRENYLGNSLHAAVGRWQKGRDITWYAKAGDSDKDQATIQKDKKAEIQSIKDAEAEAMAEALGYKTKRKSATTVTEKELKSAISKSDISTTDELDEKMKESAKVEGVGFGNRTQRMFAPGQSDTGSRSITTKINPVPVVPLIPHMGPSEGKNKTERSSRDQKRTDKKEAERHRKRHLSRSPSPSRDSRRHRGHRERSRSRGHREVTKDSDRDRNSRGRSTRHHREERQGRDRSRSGSRSRSKSTERQSRDKHSHTRRHDHSHRQEGEQNQRNDRRHRRSRSRSRSRSRGQRQ